MQKQHYSPMLWEITGNNLTHPSYLFGTFHTKNPDFTKLPYSVILKLKASNRVYTEVPMTKRSQKNIRSFTMLPHATPLKQRLHPKTIKLLLHYLVTQRIPYTLQTLKPLKVWAIALLLENYEKDSQKRQRPFMDEQIIALAKKEHIKQVGLESIKEQLSYFDSLSFKMQEQLLLSTIKNKENAAQEKALVDWYTKGQVSGFVALQDQFNSTDTKQKKLNKLLQKGLLFERNERFTRRIHILLQNNPSLIYFFAVGAGHLSDEQGLISRLKQLGYTLKKLN